MLWHRYTRYSNLLFVANEGVNTLSLCMYVPFYSTFLSLTLFLSIYLLSRLIGFLWKATNASTYLTEKNYDNNGNAKSAEDTIHSIERTLHYYSSYLFK